MNAVWQVLTVWIFIAWVWLTAYTCVQDGWLSTSCIVWAWLTVVPVWKIVWFAGKVIPKNMVLNYISSTTVWKLATTLGKYVDDVARLWEKAKILANILANTSNISSKIANWHSFSKHIHEFKSLWIITKEQFKNHIEKIIKNASNTNIKLWNNSRIAFWDDKTWTIIIYDKSSIDLWTAFIPTLWKTYFNNFK